MPQQRKQRFVVYKSADARYQRGHGKAVATRAPHLRSRSEIPQRVARKGNPTRRVDGATRTIGRLRRLQSGSGWLVTRYFEFSRVSLATKRVKNEPNETKTNFRRFTPKKATVSRKPSQITSLPLSLETLGLFIFTTVEEKLKLSLFQINSIRLTEKLEISKNKSPENRFSKTEKSKYLKICVRVGDDSSDEIFSGR